MKSHYGRREFFKLSLAAVAAATLPTVLFGSQSARRRDLVAPWPGYDSFTLGDLDITSIFDGGYELDVSPGYFAIDRSEADIEALLQSRFLPSNRTIENLAPVIVSNEADVVLFDTGLGVSGQGRGAGQLVSRMKTSGYEPQDITIIALTHLHGDNIGGLITDSKPTFPNAKYFVGEKEYKFWTEEALKRNDISNHGVLVQSTFAGLKDKLALIKGDQEVIGGIKAVEAFGHTPGHLMFRISSRGKELLLAGDVATHYVVSFERPEWHSSLDLDPVAAAATRMSVMSDVVAGRIPLIGYHLPFPPVGYVEATDKGFRWIPETYQLNL